MIYQPLVSIFVPTYQYGHYLEYCVNSITRQTYKNLEILIMDDNSSDNTSEIAEKLCKKDSRIRYIRNEPNLGHIANYNKGIELCQGELIGCVSADDALGADTIIETYVKAFEENPKLGLAFSRAQIIDENSDLQPKYIPREHYPGLSETSTVFPGHAFFKKLITENFVPASGNIARKSLYGSVNSFDPDLKHSGDWFLWLAFSLTHDVFFVPDSGIRYRIHQNNMHRTYEKPTVALDNCLLMYNKLSRLLRKRNMSRSLQMEAHLAMLRYKKKHSIKRTWSERLVATAGRIFIK